MPAKNHFHAAVGTALTADGGTITDAPSHCGSGAATCRSTSVRSGFESIEVFDNRVRRSSLGYVAPTEFERTLNQTHR